MFHITHIFATLYNKIGSGLLPQLIALDMDGTLLDAEGNIPPGFDEITTLADAHSVTLLPASGRQLATLQAMFPEHKSFLAENGTVVMHEGNIVATSPLSDEVTDSIRKRLRSVAVEHTIVVCTPETAYVERGVSDAAEEELAKYYRSVTWVDSLDEAPRGQTIKVAVFCADGSEKHLAKPLREAAPDDNVAVSGKVWVDVMAAGAHKARACASFADALNINIANTAAFGDFLNDLELLQAAGTAIAMENAHPALKEIADYIAPPNTEYGVIKVLRDWFDES
ncbi:HAD-superfamily hydrolase, subfamily IIB [Corynebacterium camporealensis]|uniref:HAD-IIB family hydrolase n=1 Tax=Corynebacterium camporealensis TaxID=161896 RepID=UPI000D20C77F|nr:HAD-superfamily hydrolase, subfamily IIB [Corynebacterium camporealensis]